MNKKNGFAIFAIVTGLLLVAVVIVSANGLVEKPFAEGEGALRTGQQVSQGAPDKPYPEGEGALSIGRRVNTNISRDALPEGLAGKAGTGSLAVENTKIASGTDALSILYQFSGVTDDGEQGSANRKEATSIHCTNIGATDTQVEVQVYQYNGTDVFTGTVIMSPNRTFTFSTQNTTIYFEDVLLGGVPGTDAIFQGSGRILSENPDVVCSAQALDPLNYPPTFVVGIEMYQP